MITITIRYPRGHGYVTFRVPFSIARALEKILFALNDGKCHETSIPGYMESIGTIYADTDSVKEDEQC